MIPCLDVDGGRVVKGVRFSGMRDAGDPVELAARYDLEGADEIVFYDITASAEGRATMLDVVARTADEVFIPLTVGGGVRTLEDARTLLRLGADKVSVNSAAVARPELIEEVSGTFGAQCTVVGVDMRRKAGPTPSWEVYVNGGRVPTGTDVAEWVTRCEKLGAGELVLNSMDRDGTRQGYDLELHAFCRRGDRHPGGGQWRRGQPPAPRRRRPDRAGRCRAGCFHLPLRRGDHRRGEGHVGCGWRDGQALAALTCSEMAPNDPASPKQAIQMLTDRVLVQVPRSEGERKSKSGILIPATAEVPRRLSWAEVVATGPHVRSIKPGDQVLFNPEDRFEVEVHGDNYLILRERDIHAVAAERVTDGTGLYL